MPNNFLGQQQTPSTMMPSLAQAQAASATASSSSSMMHSAQDAHRLPSMLGASGQNMLLGQNNATAAGFPYLGMVGMMNTQSILPSLNPHNHNNLNNNNNNNLSAANSSFLLQLHDLLTKDRQDIIVWETDGLKFSIKDILRFRALILPKYFPSKCSSVLLCCNWLDSAVN